MMLFLNDFYISKPYVLRDETTVQINREQWVRHK